MRRPLLCLIVLIAALCVGKVAFVIAQQTEARVSSTGSCRAPDAESIVSTRQFFQGVLTKNVETVQEALAAGLDPNQLDEYGNTALHWAAAANGTELIELLVRCGAQLEVRSALSGATPLVLAVDHEAVEAVTSLLTAGANPSARIVVQEGNKKVSRSLVDLAAQRNRLDLVMMLAEHGAKIADPQSNALQSAVRSKNAPLVRLLLERGARHPDMSVAAPFPVLDTVVRAAETDIAEALLSHGARSRDLTHTLSLAARSGSLRLVRAVLAAQPALNQRDQDGETPLIAAARSGSLEVVNELLDKGATPTTTATHTTGFPDEQRPPLRAIDIERTALWAAAGAGSLEVVVRLAAIPGFSCDMFGAAMLAAAAQPSQKAAPIIERLFEEQACFPPGSVSLSAALLRAARGQYADTVELLLKRGATPVPLIDPEFSNPILEPLGPPSGARGFRRWGPTKLVGFYPVSPLEVALAMRDLPVLQRLVRAGASVTRDLHQTGAFQLIASPGFRFGQRSTEAESAPIVAFLVGQGAQVDAQDAYGATALLLAAQLGDAELVQALLSAGASAALLNAEGLSAAAVAEEARHPGTARLIQRLVSLDQARAIDAQSVQPFSPEVTPLTEAICVVQPRVLPNSSPTPIPNPNLAPTSTPSFVVGRSGVVASKPRLPITPFAGYLSVDIHLDDQFEYPSPSARRALTEEVLQALAIWRMVCLNCAARNLAVAHVDGRAYMTEGCYREIRDFPNRQSPARIPRFGDPVEPVSPGSRTFSSDSIASCSKRFGIGRGGGINDNWRYMSLEPEDAVWKTACEAAEYSDVAAVLGCGRRHVREAASYIAKVAVKFTSQDTNCQSKDPTKVIACTDAHRGVTLNVRDFTFVIPGKNEAFGSGKQRVELPRVMLHEVGHWLGLAHLEQNQNIMAPVISEARCISNDNLAPLADPLNQALSLHSNALEALLEDRP